MLNDIDKLKEFILWAKKEGVKSFKNEHIQFELSDLALVTALQPEADMKADLLERARIEREVEKSEFEELLYHSSKPR